MLYFFLSATVEIFTSGFLDWAVCINIYKGYVAKLWQRAMRSVVGMQDGRRSAPERVQM